jgi:hypothetical protein
MGLEGCCGSRTTTKKQIPRGDHPEMASRTPGNRLVVASECTETAFRLTTQNPGNHH